MGAGLMLGLGEATTMHYVLSGGLLKVLYAQLGSTLGAPEPRQSRSWLGLGFEFFFCIPSMYVKISNTSAGLMLCCRTVSRIDAALSYPPFPPGHDLSVLQSAGERFSCRARSSVRPECTPTPTLHT